MEIIKFDWDKHAKAVERIFKEVGWLSDDKSFNDWEKENTKGVVAEINGAAECAVFRSDGEMRYLQEDIPLGLIAGVITSHIARKQSLAKNLTAESIVLLVEEGAKVAVLGIFDQGFYDQLGFGTNAYEHPTRFDPASLNVKDSFRVPERITKDDWEKLHRSRLKRYRAHGGCSIFPDSGTKNDLLYRSGKIFGLGYSDESGETYSHFIFGYQHGESGPLDIMYFSFSELYQVRELLALLKSLGDQFRVVEMMEPPCIQMQDFIDRPFRNRDLTQKNKFEQFMHASSWKQIRICDLPGCLQQTHLQCDDFKFQLELHDPLHSILQDRDGWNGCGGIYIVTLGKNSHAEFGEDDSLPKLKSSVGAFTRLWLGVRPASGLAISDDLTADAELLQKLDLAFRLPRPQVDWEF